MAKPKTALADVLEKSMIAADTLERKDLIFTYKGTVYPTTLCTAEIFKAMESFEARRDDVILAGFPKSGTNWFGQILSDLIATAAKNNKNETNHHNDVPEEFPYLEIGDPEKYERMKKLPPRRLIRTHMAPQNLPESIFKNKAKILLLLRNPKDLATSYYHFSLVFSPFPSYESWDSFFKDFMAGKVPWGSYFNYLSEWNKYIVSENVMPVSFEEVKENTYLGVKKIVEFFEFPLNEEEIHAVVQRSSFQSMKTNSKNTHGAFGDVLFRKGGVSDWRNLFEEKHNLEMDKMYKEHLAATTLGTRLNYDVYCKI
ncbi:sulfotransferase 6B1-like [Apteryx rowi]|uniref:sulfotransferase 6B1-like n=1 Tax=Apteryx rowi TaxID=308060 RepID=UPI000E1D0900|nr:sulfotransferase 6B1-like [Apteryx rowi]